MKRLIYTLKNLLYKRPALKRSLAVYLVFLLIQHHIVAQDGNTATNNQIQFPLSPNAASLIRVEDFQINYQTGNVGINIPLFVVEGRVIKFPISISYNSTGIKVNEEASSLGLGWRLNASGVITRSVIGAPDEEGWMQGGLPGTCDDIRDHTTYNTSDHDDFMEVKSIFNNNYDTQPDLYNFTFPGYSGSFVFGNDGVAYSETLDIISIEAKSSQLFEITTSDGYEYRFGTDLNNNSIVEETTIEPDYLYGGECTTNTAYYLTEIISPSKVDTVYFKYLPSAYSHYRVEGQYSSYLFNKEPLSSSSPVIGYTNHSTSGALVQIETFDISEIQFSTGKIIFNYDTDRLDTYSKRLESIDIYKIDKLSSLITKSIEFLNNDNYFSRTAGIPIVSALQTNSDKLSLKLEGVEIADEFQSITESYFFNYDSTALPSRETTAQDYWGYYNGKLGNVDLIPETTYVDQYGTHVFGSADRSSDGDYMKACILKEIIYPTGGCVRFDFESNYSLIGGVSSEVGGLRIKEISRYNSENSEPAEIKTFKYNESATNPGIGVMIFPHIGNNTKVETKWRHFPDDSFQKEKYYVVSSKSFEEYGFNNGSPVEYECITEYHGTVGDNTGKTEYYYCPTQFNVFYTGTSDEPYNTVLYPSYLSGYLSKIYNYSNGATGPVLISKRELTYSNIKAFSIKALKAFHRITPIEFDEELSLHRSQFYDIYNYNVVIGKRAITSETLTSFDFEGGNPIINEKSFSYDSTNLLLRETSFTDSKGDIRRNYFKYPSDALSISGLSMDDIDCLGSMVEQGWLEKVIETKEFQGDNLISTVRNYFKESESGAIQPDKVCQSFGDQTPLDVLVDYTYFDSGSNRLTQFLNNRQEVSTYVLWGYNNTYPTAKVICPSYNEIINNNVVVNVDLSSELIDPAEGVSINSFNIGFVQEVQLTLSNLVDYNNPQLPEFNISLVIKDVISGITITSFNFSSSSLSGSCSLEPGIYKIEYSKDANTSYTGSLQYISGARTAQALYESFEEDANSVDLGTAKSGSRAYLGVYSVPLNNLSEGEYSLSYWVSPNGIIWDYDETFVTITSESIFSQIGVSGQYIDEIRIRPKGAIMTTYTYKPTIGITSETGPNGITIYYEYDSFGRLSRIKDNDGNVLKVFEYNYASQIQD